MAAPHHILEQKAARILHPVPEDIVGVCVKWEQQKKQKMAARVKIY